MILGQLRIGERQMTSAALCWNSLSCGQANFGLNRQKGKKEKRIVFSSSQFLGWNSLSCRQANFGAFIPLQTEKVKPIWKDMELLHINIYDGEIFENVRYGMFLTWCRLYKASILNHKGCFLVGEKFLGIRILLGQEPSRRMGKSFKYGIDVWISSGNLLSQSFYALSPIFENFHPPFRLLQVRICLIGKFHYRLTYPSCTNG